MLSPGSQWHPCHLECVILARTSGAGVAVNSLVLNYFVSQAEEADGRDPRLVRTWLDILDEHDGPPTGTVVRGAWGILLRDLLLLDARDECYQPFTRSVDASVFGLEEL